MNDAKNWLINFGKFIKKCGTTFEPSEFLTSYEFDEVIDNRYVIFDGVKLDCLSEENSSETVLNDHNEKFYLVCIIVAEHNFESLPRDNLYVKVSFWYNSWESEFDSVNFCEFKPVTKMDFVDIIIKDTK